MPKEPKRYCECGCGKYLSARQELRHRMGHAPARILASQQLSPIRSISDSVREHTQTTMVRAAKVSKGLQKSCTQIVRGLFKHARKNQSTSQDAAALASRKSDNVSHAADEFTAMDLSLPAESEGYDHEESGYNYLPPNAVEEESDYENEEDNVNSAEQECESSDSDSLVSEDNSNSDGDSIADRIEAEWQKEWTELEKELMEEDLNVLRAFAFKTEEHLTEKTFERMRRAFPQLHAVPSLKVMKTRAQFLAAFKPVPYDCCINSCCSYLGPHADATRCPYCKEARLDGEGKPRRRYTYIPLIPRLIGYFKNATLTSAMQYRHNYFAPEKHDRSTMQDIFDGRIYQELLDRNVSVGGKQQSHKFFEGRNDIALGLSTDGFCPFKRRKQTCWPLLVFNYNLPPEIRFLINNIICIGVIPGPKKPKDFDSFLWPFVEELGKLSSEGVRVYDVTTEAMFTLRAYLILVFGDMPAMAMVMRMKGHNGLFPCRMCMIKAVRVPGSRSGSSYVPLDRSKHPTVKATGSQEVPVYDAHNLPLRDHDQFMEHARQAQFTDTSAEEERQSKSSGVKGVPLLSYLSSIQFPRSFPFDFMHLVYENLIKNLVLLWTGNFKDVDEGSGSYVLAPDVWAAVGAASAASGSTIPAAYGARPQDVSQDKSQVTADGWSFWATYLGPILLRKRFLNASYYTHFIELVKLINLCLQFEISKVEIEQVREGFIQWVKTYEKLYYQFKPDRLATCPVTVHALLHIADGIEYCGPVWAYWAFPMERFCGILQPCIKSRRFPFANIDRHVTAIAQLSHLKLKFDLHDKLGSKIPLCGMDIDERGTHIPSYPDYMLLNPRITHPEIERGLLSKIAVCLATRYNTQVKTAQQHLSVENIEMWGRVKCRGGGDVINASSLKRTQEDSRDSTFVRYEMLVDANARKKRAPVRLVPETFYGQLQSIFTVQIYASESLGIEEPESLVLAAIHTCKIEASNELDMHYYKTMGRTEVVDLSTIQCLVGRIKDRDWWVIIDRSGKLARAEFAFD